MVAFLSDRVYRRGVTPTDHLAAVRDGRRVKMAGLVLVRQRPGSGVMIINMRTRQDRSTCFSGASS